MAEVGFPGRFAVGLAFLLGGLIAAPAADAGTYQARFCVENVTPAGDKGPFERFGNESLFQLTNACGNANGLRVSQIAGNAAADGAFGRWLAERPEGITVNQIDYAAMGADQSGGYFPQVIGTVPAGELGIINGGQELDGSFKDFSVTGDVRRFGIQVVCQTGGGACAATPPGNPEAALKNIVYTLSDPSAPSITVDGGSLFEGAVQAGTQSIGFTAADSGSGVYQAVAHVNGEDAAATPGSCKLGEGYATAFAPCSPTLGGEIAVDTASAPWRNGVNNVKTCVDDYSAGSRVCGPPRKVRVLNGCGVNAPPADVGQTMTLDWPGKRGVVRSRQGRARRATARLFAPGAVPLAGAVVCFSRGIPAGDKRVERVIAAGAVTGADGRAAVKVRAQSSRSVWATYWANLETMIRKRIELRVSPAVRLGLEAPKHPEVGDRIIVRAVLRGKFKANRTVCFYATRPGRDKFDCDETGPGGRARVSYRAKKPGKINFYAKVPNQRDYPYTRGRSAKKDVRIEQ